MIASTIYNQVIDTLKNNPDLSYIKVVFKGIRNPETIEAESLPCIMVEPINDGEINRHTNQVQDLYLDLDIYAISDNNYNDLDKTIVGDEIYKGILDINNDIRACLISSNTLGNNAIDTKIQTTQFSPPDFNFKYPMRGFVIPIKILYRQQDGV